MLPKLINFIKKPTSKHVIINTLGNYINVFFVALFALILVRLLSPAEYGVFSVLLGVAYVLAPMLDMGTTATIYSYLPPLLEKKTSETYQFIKSAFTYQTFFSGLVLIILLLTFPTLDKLFFKTAAPAWELYLTTISIMLFVWLNFVLNVLYASKKFLKANLYLNGSNLIKTLLIAFMAFTHSVTVGSMIIVFGIVGPLIFFILLFIEKKDLVFVLVKSEVKVDQFKLNYALPYFVANQFMNLAQRMDLFLLSYFRLKNEVGYYGLSQKIILTILTSVVSITQVLSPSFSKIKTKGEIKSHLRTGLLYLLIPIGLFILLLFLPNQIFILFFTSKFTPTATITKALAIPYIICTLSNLPWLFLLYTIKKPVYLVLSNIALFIATTIGCLILIPKYGVYGPPVALTIGFALASLILISASFYQYKKIVKAASL